MEGVLLKINYQPLKVKSWLGMAQRHELGATQKVGRNLNNQRHTEGLRAHT